MTSTKPRVKVVLEPTWLKIIWEQFPGDNMSQKINQCVKRELDRLGYQKELRAKQVEYKALKAAGLNPAPIEKPKLFLD